MGLWMLPVLLGPLILAGAWWLWRRVFSRAMHWVTVTVHADGRVEWPDDLPAQHRGRIQAELRGLKSLTGAGDPPKWAGWTAGILKDSEDWLLEIPEGQALPVPVAVRMALPASELSDPVSSLPDDVELWEDSETEVTFDGQHWRDLFGELPPELAAFAAPSGENDRAKGGTAPGRSGK